MKLAEPYFAPLERQIRLTREAYSWEGTPFQPNQRAKGAGVDCVQLAGAIYIACGAIDRFDPGPYTMDHSAHSHRSIVGDWLDTSVRFKESTSPHPQIGDLVTFRIGLTSHHVGICLHREEAAWAIIHCYRGQTTRVDVATDDFLDRYPIHQIWRPIE